MNLQQLIQSRWETLSPTERSVARTFLERNEELVFMNATELAASLELYPSSITRFAQKLGFKGYPALQQAVRLEPSARWIPRAIKLNGREKHFPTQIEMIHSCRSG